MCSEADRGGRQDSDFPIELPVYAITPGHEGLILTSEYGLPIWTDEDQIRTFLKKNGLELTSYSEIHTAGSFLELLESARAAGVAEVVVEGKDLQQEWAVAICVDVLIGLLNQHARIGQAGWQ